MRIAVLMTCFNRVETTLKCLRHLYAAEKPSELVFDVWLNDDSSPDETGIKVKSEFSLVNVINGSGHDYWCGGMRRVWSEAASSRIDYDGYLWLNDDTILFRSALKELIGSSNSTIIVGATLDKDSYEITYSGRDVNGRKMIPNGAFQACHYMNGNAVFIPQNVFQKIGNFPSYLTHGIGDYDYGLRAKKFGFDIFLAPSPVGVCEAKKFVEKWRRMDVSFLCRLKDLYSPLGGPEPHVFFRYNITHFGIIKALRVFICQHLEMCIPSAYRKLKG